MTQWSLGGKVRQLHLPKSSSADVPEDLFITILISLIDVRMVVMPKEGGPEVA